MPDRHVQPAEDEWTVTVPGEDQVTVRTASEVEAVERAVDIVADHGGGQVVVHGGDGEVLETRHVDAGTTEISRTAAEIAENAGVEGAVETVEAALGETREGDDGDGSADGAGGRTEQVGDEAERAADRVGAQIHAVTEAAAAPLDHLAHTLNPVRVTGRVVGVLVSGGLHLVGAGAARGTAAERRTPEVAGR